MTNKHLSSSNRALVEHMNIVGIAHIRPSQVQKFLKNNRYSLQYIIKHLKDNSFKFNFKLHDNVDTIFKDYYLNFKTCKEIGIKFNITEDKVRYIIKSHNCNLRTKNFNKKTSFTPEQEAFIKAMYFVRPKISTGVFISKFNQKFHTKKTYIQIEIHLKKLKLWK